MIGLRCPTNSTYHKNEEVIRDLILKWSTRISVIKRKTLLPYYFFLVLKIYSLFTFKSSCACAVEGIDPVVTCGAILARVSDTVIDVFLAVEAMVPIHANTGVRRVFVDAGGTVFTWHVLSTLVDVHTCFLGD